MFRNRRYNTIHRTTRSITMQLLRPTKTIRRYTYSRLYAIIYDHGSRLVTIGNMHMSYHSNDQWSGCLFFSQHFIYWSSGLTSIHCISGASRILVGKPCPAFIFLAFHFFFEFSFESSVHLCINCKLLGRCWCHL